MNETPASPTKLPREELLPATERGPALAVRAHLLPNARAAVFCCHGISEHSGRLAHLERALVEAGFSVLLLDLPGHGRSGSVATPGGRELRVHIEQFDDYFEALDRWFLWADELERAGALPARVPRFLLGHSLGGLICARYMALERPTLRGLLCFSAAFELHLGQRFGAALAHAATGLWSGRSYLLRDRLTRALSIGALRRGLSRDPQVWEEFQRDELVHVPFTVRLASQIAWAGRDLALRPERPVVPQLVLHGTDDPLTFQTGSVRYALSCPRETTRLELFEGFRHELHNDPERERVFALCKQWIAEQAARSS